MNAIENLINDMIKDKIYMRILKIKDQNKVSLFLVDCGPYIESKQIRTEIETDRIKVFLGPESLKQI